MLRFGRSEGGERLDQRAAATTKRWAPALCLLIVVAIAYFGFHAIRSHLPPGFLRSSFPSLLAPLGMFGVIELLPGVRFRSRRIKWLILGATTALAALWLEAIVPLLTPAACGTWRDSGAMAAGLLLFALFDWLWGDVTAGESLDGPF